MSLVQPHINNEIPRVITQVINNPVSQFILCHICEFLSLYLPFTTHAYIGICCHYNHRYERQALKAVDTDIR